MGYYTTFSLSVKGGEITEEMQLELENSSSFEGYKHGVEELIEGWFDSKWYEWEKDIRELSVKFPENVFILEGQGEENDDHWIAYFKNGGMQFCKGEIVYEEMDLLKII